MSPRAPDEPERDAWLSEALRHAPDADATPPAALRETILRQARAATAATQAPNPARVPGRWAAAWSWLARPPVAAGFASVMVATLVGLMWWDRPMDEALPRPPAPGSQPPAAAAPAADAAAVRTVEAPVGGGAEPARKTDAVPTAPARADREGLRSVAPPREARPKPAALDRAAPAPFADERKREAVTPPMAAKSVVAEAATAPAPKPDPAAAPAPLAAPAKTALVAPPQTPPAPEMRRRDAPAAAIAEVPAGASRDESGASLNAASGALAARAFAKSAAPPPATALAAPLRQQDTVARLAPLAELLASIAERPQRWSWQRDANEQPMTPGLQRWLLQLDGATAARWRAATEPPAPGDGSALRLFRDGALQATLRLGDDGVWLAPAAAGAALCTLPPAVLAALKLALDDAAR